MVSKILSLIPKHKIYIEPFFGGGAVFFAKKPSYLEVVNDINDNLVTFYRVCQKEDTWNELNAQIQSSLFSEALFLQAKTIWNGYWPATDIQRAWATWVVCNYSFNATPHGGWKWDMGTAGCHSGIVAAHKRNNFTSALFDRLKYAQISCRNAVNVLHERSSAESFAYIDPPYIGCDQKHYHGYGDKEFRQLLDELEQHYAGKFILSTFANDTIEEYVIRNNWNVDGLTRFASISNLRSKPNNRKKTELLIYNFQKTTLF